MICPVIEISEVAQIIIDYLVQVSPKSVVSLACTCRALEDQALCTLWSDQDSLETLVENTLLPDIRSRPLPQQQPTRAQWDRFRKYASWMRTLHFGWKKIVSDEVLCMISAEVQSGFLCPQLRKIAWTSWRHRTFNNLFVSSRLTEFRFCCNLFNVEAVAGLLSVMAELPTFRLQTLDITFPPLEDPFSTTVTTALSSFILRCGSSLTEISILAHLTDAAIRHIMQLPELTVWETTNGLPDVPGLSPLDTFPKLERLFLHTAEALNWLPFFKTDAHRTSSNQVTNTPRNRGPYQTLTTIGYEYGGSFQVDAAFMSPVMLFHGLKILRLKQNCSEDWCGFRLTDDDVGEMVDAFPNLNTLDLGGICHADSCQTTVASLLIISTHCEDLKELKIHFRIGNLFRDLHSTQNNPRLSGLYQLPKCGVRKLYLSEAPLRTEDDRYYHLVAKEFIKIFPSIDYISGERPGWGLVVEGLRKMRGIPGGFPYSRLRDDAGRLLRPL